MMMMGFGGETDVVMRRESYGDRMQQACAHAPPGFQDFRPGLD